MRRCAYDRFQFLRLADHQWPGPLPFGVSDSRFSETTPLAKIRGTQEFGAEIVLFGGGYDEAYEKALQLQTSKGYTFIHAGSHIFTML